jgi:hypothetical protein
LLGSCWNGFSAGGPFFAGTSFIIKSRLLGSCWNYCSAGGFKIITWNPLGISYRGIEKIWCSNVGSIVLYA